MKMDVHLTCAQCGGIQETEFELPLEPVDALDLLDELRDHIAQSAEAAGWRYDAEQAPPRRVKDQLLDTRLLCEDCAAEADS